MWGQQNSNVVITGYGMVSSMGLRPHDIWLAATSKGNRERFYDSTIAAPFICHPACLFDPKEYIESKAVLHLLGQGQLHALVSAAEALQCAGISKENPLLRDATLIVAAGDGNRDEEKDEQLFERGIGLETDAMDQYLNHHFSRCRPSTFLAGLPNLYSANISSFFDIRGESITLTGDELAGMNAFDLAYKKIATNESECVVVGGAAYGTKKHLLLYCALNDSLCNGQFLEVWERPGHQLCLGSGAAFLVLESESHAKARSVPEMYLIKDYSIQLTDRNLEVFNENSSLVKSSKDRIQALLADSSFARSGILSCSCGSGKLAKAEEMALLDLETKMGISSENQLNIRSSSNFTGSLFEASFPFGIALGCMCLHHGKLITPFNPHSRVETLSDHQGAIDALIVNCFGYYMAEASVMLESHRKI